MRTLILALATLVTLVAPAKASAKATSCAGFLERSSPIDVNRFYATRAIDIVRAGLDGDKKSLDVLVSPIARFELWRGDTGTGRQGGVAGAIEMARNLAPTRFQTVSDRPGPISISPVKCEWTTFLLLRTQQPNTGINVRFKFVDGLLLEAVGHEVDLYEGDVR